MTTGTKFPIPTLPPETYYVIAISLLEHPEYLTPAARIFVEECLIIIGFYDMLQNFSRIEEFKNNTCAQEADLPKYFDTYRALARQLRDELERKYKIMYFIPH